MPPSLKLSSRLDRFQPSITLAITGKAKTLRAQGVDVLSFGAGEPDFDTPDHIKEAARQGLDKGVSKYTVVSGIAPLREAVATTLSAVHKVELSSDQVLVSVGGKHSYNNLCMALLDDGDEVIIPAPYWVSYPDIVKLAGGKPVIIETRAEDDFAVTPEALEAAITPRTKAMVLNSPSNPTGAVYSRQQLEALAEVVIKHGIWVISDDIYRSLVYGDTEYTSFASLSPEAGAHTILVDGVSKAYAMTGWRIGFTAGPRELIKGMAKLQGQTTSGATHIAQVAALAAISGSQDCVETMRQAFDKRRQLILELLRAIPGVTCREPRGAFYAFPNLGAYVGKKTPKGEKLADDVALCSYVLDTGRVAIVPGSAFGAPGFARMSYACSEDDIRQGLARMGEALSQLS
ncbi:MAG: pyridoxal phosphate-dependent aminotransferase [Myxococcota bacterium]